MGQPQNGPGILAGVWIAFLALVVLAQQFEQWRNETEERKRDARRKIIVGAAALPHADVDPGFRAALRVAMRAAVTRDIYRQGRNPRSAWIVIGVRVATEQF
jgi:hypothetical protein